MKKKVPKENNNTTMEIKNLKKEITNLKVHQHVNTVFAGWHITMTAVSLSVVAAATLPVGLLLGGVSAAFASNFLIERLNTKEKIEDTKKLLLLKEIRKTLDETNELMDKELSSSVDAPTRTLKKD